ncbi:Uma2 family endonuclease [Gordonia sp. PDNC005]|uniref:Uma2 family endonuclease n=1 Tax=Gordonia sp. PDNC005 TaxID=2811424 RepID=UPI00196375B6|nr:Uma2 family endonuclease [Gordonia sp. PDNC005]QRY63413.1 Uma2 family endonuclease [Gordonia sp. PDNC005]
MTTMTTQIVGLPHGRPMTRADLGDMPDDGQRYELLDGLLIVSPAPITRHQRALLRLAVALYNASPEDVEVLTAPFDVVLSEDTVIQPDIVVARKSDLTERDLPGAPLLSVEVLSPSTRSVDELLKKDRLARAGCPHYWIVDPSEPSIRAWELNGRDYQLVAHSTGHEAFSAVTPITVTVKPADLVD